MSGLELWDICAGRHRGNPMSVEANERTNKGRDRARILAFLADVADATGEEVSAALGMRHQTTSARMSELKREGLLAPTVRRPTASGCSAQAWALKREEHKTE